MPRRILYVLITATLFTASTSYSAAQSDSNNVEAANNSSSSPDALKPNIPNISVHPRNLISASTDQAPDSHSEQALNAKAPQGNFVYWVIGIVVVLTLLSLSLVRQGLSHSKWRLGDALSESVDLTTENGVPIKVLKASSSRLIAFNGLIVILVLYFGFGLMAIYQIGFNTLSASTLDGVQKFMLSGLTLFAPYAVNQARSALDSINSTSLVPSTSTNQIKVDNAPLPKGSTVTPGGC